MTTMPGSDPAARTASPDDGPSLVTPELFKSVFRRHPAGVAVVTLADGDLPYGFTATSVISVSADPPILTFSIDSSSSSWPALSRADTLVINFLAASQVDVSARFATRGIDRFLGTEWIRLPTGEPVLEGSAAWVRGRVVQRSAVGRSFLVSVLVLEATQGDPTSPLVYHDRTYHAVGEDTAI